MNIGIRLHDTKAGTLTERLGFARAQGFSCVHLALSKTVPGFSMNDVPALLTAELAEQLKGDFAAHQMECAVLGCYLSLAKTDEEELRKIQSVYRAHLKFGRMMGATVVGTETPLKGLAFSEPAWQSEEAFQLFVKGLRPVVRFAEEEGAVIAVEPVCDHIVSTPEKAERLLDMIPSDNLRIILDSVNLLWAGMAGREEEVIEECIRRFGDKISVLHMKDYLPPVPGDIRVRPTACGTGMMKYEKLLSFGKRKNLPMTMENTNPENAQAAREFLETLGEKL